jgi:hypothetical protein
LIADFKFNNKDKKQIADPRLLRAGTSFRLPDPATLKRFNAKCAEKAQGAQRKTRSMIKKCRLPI